MSSDLCRSQARTELYDNFVRASSRYSSFSVGSIGGRRDPSTPFGVCSVVDVCIILRHRVTSASLIISD